MSLKIKSLKPMFSGILCTANKYNEYQFVAGTNIVDSTKTVGQLKEYQTVIAIGSMVRNVEVGDVVCINPKNYAERMYEKGSTKSSMTENYNPVVRYHFNIVEVNDVDHLLIQENDVDFVVTDSEEIEDTPPVQNIISEKKPTIIMPN